MFCRFCVLSKSGLSKNEYILQSNFIISESNYLPIYIIGYLLSINSPNIESIILLYIFFIFGHSIWFWSQKRAFTQAKTKTTATKSSWRLSTWPSWSIYVTTTTVEWYVASNNSSGKGWRRNLRNRSTTRILCVFAHVFRFQALEPVFTICIDQGCMLYVYNVSRCLHMVYGGYMGYTYIWIGAIALESTHTQRDYSLRYNEAGSYTHTTQPPCVHVSSDFYFSSVSGILWS